MVSTHAGKRRTELFEVFLPQEGTILFDHEKVRNAMLAFFSFLKSIYMVSLVSVGSSETETQPILSLYCI